MYQNKRIKNCNRLPKQIVKHTMIGLFFKNHYLLMLIHKKGCNSFSLREKNGSKYFKRICISNAIQ